MRSCDWLALGSSWSQRAKPGVERNFSPLQHKNALNALAGKCHVRTLAELTEAEDPVGKRKESPLDGNASSDGPKNTYLPHHHENRLTGIMA